MELANFELISNTAPTLRFSLVIPEDVTGWTTTFVAKRKATDANAALSVNGVIADANAGIFDVGLSTALLANLTPGTYVYTFRRTNAGAEDVLTTGNFTLKLLP